MVIASVAQAQTRGGFDSKGHLTMHGTSRFVLGVYDSGGGYSTDPGRWEQLIFSPTGDRGLQGFPLNVYLNYWLGNMPIGPTNALLDVLNLQLSYLLDFVDGEVARLTDRRSTVGGFLDLLGHGVLKASLPLAVGAAAGWQTGHALLALAGGIAAVVIVVGDTLRFYAACTVNELAGGDLGHTVVALEPRGGRRPTPGKLVATAFDLSFESPGLYGLALAAALVDRLDVLVVYWAVGGFGWFWRRATTYCRRMA